LDELQLQKLCEELEETTAKSALKRRRSSHKRKKEKLGTSTNSALISLEPKQDLQSSSLSEKDPGSVVVRVVDLQAPPDVSLSINTKKIKSMTPSLPSPKAPRGKKKSSTTDGLVDSLLDFGIQLPKEDSELSNDIFHLWYVSSAGTEHKTIDIPGAKNGTIEEFLKEQCSHVFVEISPDVFQLRNMDNEVVDFDTPVCPLTRMPRG
jgi:hypothetical protein